MTSRPRIISAELLQTLVDYLVLRPYIEVHQVIAGLLKLEEAPLDTSLPAAESTQ